MAKGETVRATKVVKISKAAKLKSLQLVDGKSEDSRTYANIKTIDEIMGIKPQGAFKAKSVAEFEDQLNTQMNLADMQALASRVGLLPIHDRNVLKKRLLDEFKKDLRKKLPYEVIDAVSDRSGVSEEHEAKALRILKEGV